MVVTVATPPVWRAVRQVREKVPILPALREYATMMKQVCFEEFEDVQGLKEEHFSFF